MFAKIAKEFQNITKFDLLQYFLDYRDFLSQDYVEVYNYFAGNSESVEASKLIKLSHLIELNDTLKRTFNTFAGKLGNVGYWELMSYCQDLGDTLERINKLPKYLRTAKSCRGYKAFVQTEENVGGYRTIQDIADIYGTTEQELILNNDLQESDYDIKELSSINALIDNRSNIVVTTILEQPIGKRVYGKDIARKITFENNDLQIKSYEDNVTQKIEILLELNKGDVPEMPSFGKNLAVGSDGGNYNYAELVKDLLETFKQDDLFQSIEILDVTSNNGDIIITVEIRTKYEYSAIKNINI